MPAWTWPNAGKSRCMPAINTRSAATMAIVRKRVAAAASMSTSKAMPQSGRANCSAGACTMSPQISRSRPLLATW